MKKISLAAASLILCAAITASAAPQDLSSYLEENLAKTDMSADQRASVLRAVREKFANFSTDALSGAKLDGAQTVLALLSSGCRSKTPGRAAEVSLAAYRGVLRGADPALAEALSRKACEADISANLLSSWLNGWAEMKSGGVPAYVAEELVLTAMEKGWPGRTFDTLKWGLVDGVKSGFEAKRYAGYLLAGMLKDPSGPGRKVSDAKALFKNAADGGPDAAYQFRKAPAAPVEVKAVAPEPKPEAPKPEAPQPKAPPSPGAENASPSTTALPSAPPEPTPLFDESFRAGNLSLWDPIGVVGGSFEKFAKAEDGALRVSVPEQNSWGKTGVMSKTPFITVQNSTEAAPQKVVFSFDENETTGYVIALSPAKDPDVWRQYNAWLHWARQSVTAGAFNFVNTQNGSEAYGTVATPAKAPGTVTLLIKPGSIRFETSQGAAKEGAFSWLKPGASAYLYIFSHPPTENAAAAFTLKSIKVY